MRRCINKNGTADCTSQADPSVFGFLLKSMVFCTPDAAHKSAPVSHQDHESRDYASSVILCPSVCDWCVNRTLTQAMLESEKEKLIRVGISEGDAWLEYIFGICKPDQRVGKLGSRWFRFGDPCPLHCPAFGSFAVQKARRNAADLRILGRLIHPNSRFVRGKESLREQRCEGTIPVCSANEETVGYGVVFFVQNRVLEDKCSISEPWIGKSESECCAIMLNPRRCAAAMLFVSGVLLLYTAAVVPAQIFLWDYSDPCNRFPTLFFDLAVDTFFLVSLLPSCRRRWRGFGPVAYLSEMKQTKSSCWLSACASPPPSPPYKLGGCLHLLRRDVGVLGVKISGSNRSIAQQTFHALNGHYPSDDRRIVRMSAGGDRWRWRSTFSRA